MNRNDAVYWALAREHAPQVLGRAEPDQNCRAIIEADGNLADLITQMRGSCAVISITGEIGKDTWISHFTGGIYRLGQDLIRMALAEALASPRVKSILLAIDSPGGIVQGTKELADYIAEAAKAKPMAAYANGLCASAAFWLAAATGAIYAPATALVGSIGVIMRLENWAGYYTRAGVQIEYITSGAYKAAGQDGKELTEAERAYFEGQLAELHSIFREDVRKTLGLTAPDALWGEAQLMPATLALPLGLVSRIVRDEEEAVKLLAETNFREERMDITELKAKHPDLVEAISRETEEKIRAQFQAAADSARNDLLACVKAVAGADAAKRVEMLANSGITASQLEALKPLFDGFKAEAASRREQNQTEKDILTAITGATGAPLPSAAGSGKKNALVADAERRAAQRQVM